MSQQYFLCSWRKINTVKTNKIGKLKSKSIIENTSKNGRQPKRLNKTQTERNTKKVRRDVTIKHTTNTNVTKYKTFIQILKQIRKKGQINEKKQLPNFN